MSRLAHIFRPGKKDPYRCAYKMEIENPDGELEKVSCGEPKISFVHPIEKTTDQWSYKYNPKDLHVKRVIKA